MKTRKRNARLFFRLRTYGAFIDEAYWLEKALAKRPYRLTVEMVGSGEVPPDAALLMRSIILNRPAGTHLVMNSRSSLRGATVLLWLLGDTRMIREDARLFLRAAGPFSVGNAPWKDRDSFDDDDLEEDDYIRVLRFIDEFLPVKELVGQPVERAVLKQFGLIDSEQMDQFLAAAFQKQEPPLVRPRAVEKRKARKEASR